MSWDEDDNVVERQCEVCGELRKCELIPLHGYSKWMCKTCACKAYKSEKAV